MSGADLAPGARRGRGLRVAAVVGLMLLALLAAAQAAQAWVTWQDRALPAWAGDVGAPVSVLLVNGQVYYGEVAELSAGYLRLYNVYYVQTLSAPGAAAPSNQLVNRSKADWHGPQWMAIPTEKIVLVEGIGAKSRLSALIAEEKKLPAAN